MTEQEANVEVEDSTESTGQVVKYNVTNEALEDLKAKYLIIPDASTPKGYNDVKTGIAELRETWVGVEKHRKVLKAESLEYGRKVDAEAKRITTVLTDIVEPLKEEKAKADTAKEEAKAEKKRAEESRVAAIEKRAEDMQDLCRECVGKTSQEIYQRIAELEATEISEDDYQEMTERATILKGKLLDRMNEIATSTLKAEETAIEQEKREADLKRCEEEMEAKRKEQEANDKAEREEREAKEEIARQDRERLQKIEDDKQASIRSEEAEKLRKQQEDMQKQQEEIDRQKQEMEEKRLAEEKRIADEAAEKQKKIDAEELQKSKDAYEADLKKKQEAEEKAAKERYETSRGDAIDSLVGSCEMRRVAELVFKEIEAGNIPHITFNA